ncbi:signal peptidase II [Desulfosporosinus burensis]
MLVWLAMIGVWGIDRLVKVLVQTNFIPGETLIVIPKIFHLTYVLNPGAAFGLMAGQTWIFVVTAFLVVGGVIYGQFRISRDETITRLALGMIGGGALGNLYDRLVIGRVVDYLDFQIWPYVFNFADSMIVVGAGLLMLALYQEEKSKDQSKDESKGEFKDQPNGESITEK